MCARGVDWTDGDIWLSALSFIILPANGDLSAGLFSAAARTPETNRGVSFGYPLDTVCSWRSKFLSFHFCIFRNNFPVRTVAFTSCFTEVIF